MRRLLLTLLSAGAISATAFAGTVYQLSTLEEVVANNEKFALIASGTINYPLNSPGNPYLIWSTGFTSAKGNGAKGYIRYSANAVTPARFDRSMFTEASGYNARPALFSLEDAGTTTSSGLKCYYLAGTIQNTPEATPVTRYVGIAESTGPFASSPTKVVNSTAYQMYFEPATNTWTDDDGNQVTVNTCYKISSLRQPNRAIMCIVNSRNGILIGAGSSNVGLTFLFRTTVIPTSIARFPPQSRFSAKARHLCASLWATPFRCLHLS